MSKIKKETEQLLKAIVELQYIPSHNKEDIQECVENHVNILLNFSYDNILDSIKGELTDYGKGKIEILLEMQKGY